VSTAMADGYATDVVRRFCPRSWSVSLCPAFNALSRTTALIQLGRDVRGDFNLIDFGLGPDKANSLVDTSVTMPHCVRYG
jgi:hypothetical protein